jgi:hypothetical protein
MWIHVAEDSAQLWAAVDMSAPASHSRTLSATHVMATVVWPVCTGAHRPRRHVCLPPRPGMVELCPTRPHAPQYQMLITYFSKLAGHRLGLKLTPSPKETTLCIEVWSSGF